METPIFEHESENHHWRGFISGLLLGGLAGTVAMLLVAPQSGKKTRAELQKKSMELRNQTVEAAEGVMTEARTKAHQITSDVRDKADELQQRGQVVLDEQKERLSAVVESGNKVVQGLLD